MKTNQKENITRKLVIGFCLLIIIFVSYGLFSLYEIRVITNLTRTIYNHPLVVQLDTPDSVRLSGRSGDGVCAYNGRTDYADHPIVHDPRQSQPKA